MNTTLFPLASLSAALGQELFPGKILIWLLFMCSILAWVVILSKGAQLLKVRKGNRRFTLRLRQSHSVLEMIQEGWEDEDSPRYLVYRSAAREAVARLLGTHRWDAGDLERLGASSRLEERHLSDLRNAVLSGHRHGMMLLESGLRKIPLIALGAGLIGVFGFGWSLQHTLVQALPFESFASQASVAIVFLGLVFAVAGPVLLATLWFRAIVERERGDLSNFGDELVRLFERCLISGVGLTRPNHAAAAVSKPVQAPPRRASEGASPAMATSSHAAELSPPGQARLSPNLVPTPEVVRLTHPEPIRQSRASRESREPTLQPDYDAEVPYLQQATRKYHSLRESSLSGSLADSNQGEEADEEMNPIARQASREARSWSKA